MSDETRVERPGSPLCRFCGATLFRTFVDLGMSPLCESYVSPEQLDQVESFYPLHVYVCHRCLLVQLREYVQPERIFSEYAYFSSYSDAWLEHAARYTEVMIQRFGIDHRSSVVELASNDGYLLRNFVARGIPAIGIEPAANVAAAAVARGVPTRIAFFGRKLAEQLVAEGIRADLLVANNVLAQVPDLNDFVSGMARLLGPTGVVTIEVPHLLRLIRDNQFDTIYHEHFSYFSFSVLERILGEHGLVVFNVEELETHGGSMRIYARHAADSSQPVSDRVGTMRRNEKDEGLTQVESYDGFAETVRATKRALLRFLIDARAAGKSIAGYGAPGKGNTLLNYCGIRTDFLDYTVDRNPYKQGKFTPGTHIPICDPQKIDDTKPDYLLILPWNFKDEIMHQMRRIRGWGGKFVVPIPRVTVVD